MEEQAGHLSEAVSVFTLDEAELQHDTPAPARARTAAPIATPSVPRRPASRQPATELADGDWQEF